MTLFNTTARLAIALGLAALAPAANAQLHFNFQFDDTFDSTVTPPIVGTGSFDLASDPGNGTFAWNSLASPTTSFTFPGATYTNANITSDLSKVLVVISPYTSGQRRIQFSDTGAGDGTVSAGSLDLVQPSGTLSFEPSYIGAGLNLYQVFDIPNSPPLQGSYIGLTSSTAATPEPGSIALLTGLMTVGAGVLRKRRK